MDFSANLLHACMPAATMAACAAWAEPLSDAMATYGMDTPQRMAGFLGSVANETGSLRATKEISYYDTDYDYCRERVFGRRMPSREVWESWRAQGREAFYKLSFDHLYSDILWPWLGLGNTQPGDGSRYVGRGVGITGRYLYGKYGKVAGIDLIEHPELLEQPRYAAITIAAMWKDVGNNERLDRGDAYGAFKALNPGGDGDFFDPHMGYYHHILGVLTNGPGLDVKALQQALMAAGFDLPKYGADGDFGNETRAAVRAFQTARGLPVTGQADDKTRKALGLA